MKVTFQYIRFHRFHCRRFSTTLNRRDIRDISELPDRICAKYKEISLLDLFSLQWPSPPRNVLLVKKPGVDSLTESLIEFAKHVSNTYPSISIILEPRVAATVHETLPFPVYINTAEDINQRLHDKVDVTATFGGDGTILHATSLFATSRSVPPILSFSMGTLGFLGEWKFSEFKRAFREVYMSGAGVGEREAYMSGSNTDNDNHARNKPGTDSTTSGNSTEIPPQSGWSTVHGKSMGSARGARALLRNRLKVGIFNSSGQQVPIQNHRDLEIHAMNEVILHRGADPHLTHISISLGGRFLTEAVADGMIISTPTGSTAYSLSSGGSIIHPFVASICLTPICPRSLSFRPLVLPAHTPISLRLSEHNRSKEVEVSIDGRRRSTGIGVGTEVRVWGETITKEDGYWSGGVPCIMRVPVGDQREASGSEGWVGGLNELLKFNYPFGEE